MFVQTLPMWLQKALRLEFCSPSVGTPSWQPSDCRILHTCSRYWSTGLQNAVLPLSLSPAHSWNTRFRGSEALAQVAQRTGGCSIPGDSQGQAGGALSAWWSCRCHCSLQGGWARGPLRAPFNSNHFRIEFLSWLRDRPRPDKWSDKWRKFVRQLISQEYFLSFWPFLLVLEMFSRCFQEILWVSWWAILITKNNPEEPPQPLFSEPFLFFPDAGISFELSLSPESLF